MQSALGGAQNIVAIRDFDEIFRAETWDRDGRSLGIVRKRVRWIKPNYLRIDQSGPYDTYVLFFDGSGGWEIIDLEGPSRRGLLCGIRTGTHSARVKATTAAARDTTEETRIPGTTHPGHIINQWLVIFEGVAGVGG